MYRRTEVCSQQLGADDTQRKARMTSGSVGFQREYSRITERYSKEDCMSRSQRIQRNLLKTLEKSTWRQLVSVFAWAALLAMIGLLLIIDVCAL